MRIEQEGFDKFTDLQHKYHELIYAVCRVFPGESRHDTALRYIQEAEKAATHSETKNAGIEPS